MLLQGHRANVQGSGPGRHVDDQVPGAVHDGRESGRQHRRRVDLLDDGRSVQRTSGNEGLASGPESDSLRAFNEAYVAEYGELSPLPFIREAYDAAIAIGLAAEVAGSTDSEAIRNSLRAAAAPPGDAYAAGAAGIAGALGAIRGGEQIDYAGAATSLDWDDNGDVTSGYIGVWQYAEGTIEEVSVTAFDLGGGPIAATPRASDDDQQAMISDEPLKIGLLADFSGPLAEFGPSIQTGVELAIKHLNDGGGVLGRPGRARHGRYRARSNPGNRRNPAPDRGRGRPRHRGAAGVVDHVGHR